MKDHWRAAKKVMRYFQRTKDIILACNNCDDFEIVVYAGFDLQIALMIRNLLRAICLSWLVE